MPRMALALAGLCISASPVALAQSRVMPVAERIADDHAPLGVRQGAFLVIPRVDLEESIRDNIYVMPKPRRHDVVTTVRPEIALKSNWNRHGMNMLARAEVNRFASNSRENTNNYVLAIDGKLDIRHSTHIGGGLGWRRDHEDRGNPDTPDSVVMPQQYETTTAKLGFYRGLGRLNARMEAEMKRLDYKNNMTVDGVLVHSSLRNRDDYAQSLRLGYKVTPRFELFAKGRMDNRIYETKAPLNRSSRGHEYALGAGFDIFGKARGDVYAGMMQRRYRAETPGLSAPAYGAKLTWNPSDLTTVVARLDRSTEETSLAGANGYVASRYSAGVQHALTRKLVARADAGMDVNAYRGAAATQRRDTMLLAGVGADYYLNRLLRLGIGYTHKARNSSMTGGDYRSNTVILRLSATY